MACSTLLVRQELKEEDWLSHRLAHFQAQRQARLSHLHSGVSSVRPEHECSKPACNHSTLHRAV